MATRIDDVPMTGALTTGAPTTEAPTTGAPTTEAAHPAGAIGADLAARLRARIGEILNRRPAVGLAVGVVRGGGLEFFHGHGLADIASGTPITEDTVFRVGSITKTFTAIAVLQLWERGLVDLDAPANGYLRAYELVPAEAGHRPPTVRHLLTHTAGLPELVYPSRAFLPILGETVPHGDRVPTLAEFYRGGLHLVAEPGTVHTYSNHGFATLGQIVEDVTGEKLGRYLREHVFDPLGMTHTDLARSDRLGRLATGYRLRSGGPRPVDDWDVVPVGAGAAYSTVRDLARYVAALLGGGADEHGSVLAPDTLASMFAPHYQPDPRVPGVGLAFFRHVAGGHLLVEHDGLVPGFSSQLTVAPGDGVGVIAFTNGARNAHSWLGAEVSGLLRDILGVPQEPIRTDVAHRPEIWGELCGWYSFAGSFRDVQRWFIAGAQVTVRGGELVLRPLSPVPALARGLPLHPDDGGDPYAFRVDLSDLGMGTSRVIFSREPGRGVTSFHLDFAPLSFRRRPLRRAALAAAPGSCARGAGGLAAAIRSRASRVRPGPIPVRDVSLFVDVVGNGYPLVLMHGGPSVDHTTLGRLRQCADQLTLVFYDHRCNGRSTGAPVSSMTWENLTADADALRERLGFERWAVLGHSFGGHVALEYALRYPDRVSHLVLLNTAAESRWAQQNAPEVLAQRGHDPEKVELVRRWFNGEFTRREYYRILLRIGDAYASRPSLWHTALDLARGEWRIKVRPEAMIFASGRLMKGWTVKDRLGEITVPTLVMAGRDDFVFPPQAQLELVEGIPDARLRLIDGAGHNPQSERTAEVVAALRQFLPRSPA